MTPTGLPSRRVMFPATWPLPGEPLSGRLTFERRFGYPGRIDSHERVWLVGDGVVGLLEISLQGQRLGTVASPRFAFDVTRLLSERNHLAVSLDASQRPGLWDDIALEIRASAYLDGVHRDGPSVRGRVAGTCDGPLEIYILAAERRCGYCQLAAGESFTLDAEPGPIRVELVNVSTVWDVVELPEEFIK